MFTIPPGYVNVAAISHSTRSLGPGNRAVVWVQGCSFQCPGCLAPDWLPHRLNRLFCLDELTEELLSSADVSGLTFSGGEPMLQAHALARVAELARKQRSLTLITFTGFLYEDLLVSNSNHAYRELLAQTDVLIDGPYVRKHNDGIGLRGSNNQRIIYLSTKLLSEDLEHTPRMVEMHLSNKEAQIIGIPTKEILDSFLKALPIPLDREGAI